MISELTVEEVHAVSGAEGPAGGGGGGNRGSNGGTASNGSNSAADYIGDAVGAACGFFARRVGQAAGCAVLGNAVADMIRNAPDLQPTDPMDTKLGINTGRR